MKIKVFTARWCRTCTLSSPQINAAQLRHPDITWEFYDHDLQDPEFLAHEVVAVPTLIGYSDSGKQLARFTGGMGSETMIEVFVQRMRGNDE